MDPWPPVSCMHACISQSVIVVLTSQRGLSEREKETGRKEGRKEGEIVHSLRSSLTLASASGARIASIGRGRGRTSGGSIHAIGIGHRDRPAVVSCC